MPTQSSTSLAIKGGTVVNEGLTAPMTVLLADGYVVQLMDPDQELPTSVQTVVNAEGKLVIPGGVDPHCHVHATAGRHTTLDDYTEASTAALLGGTTTLIDFAIPVPGERPVDAARARMRAAQSAACDVAFHGCVTEPWPDLEKQLQELAAMGILTVKLFTTYRDTLMAADSTILQVMDILARLGGMAYIHAEDNTLIESTHASLTERSEMVPAKHASTRPEITEVSAVQSVLSIAEYLRTPVYFVHQTTPAAVDAVTAARRRGISAYSETCPHYILLDDTAYQGAHPERFVCCPPLRQRTTVDQLYELVMQGTTHALGSDHNCFDTEQKLSSSHDVREMPNGLPGVEVRLPLLFSELVHKGGMPPEMFVSLTAGNPARLNGLYPRKGVIAPGSDADIVVLDTDQSREIRADELHMPTDYSPFEGINVTGWPSTVISKGNIVYDGNELSSSIGAGEVLRAQPLTVRDLF